MFCCGLALCVFVCVRRGGAEGVVAPGANPPCPGLLVLSPFCSTASTCASFRLGCSLLLRRSPGAEGYGSPALLGSFRNVVHT